MTRAYILINAEVGTDTTVLGQLKTISAVKEVHFVYGVYDFICRIETTTMSQINEILKTKIQTIDSIRTVVTMVCAEP